MAKLVKLSDFIKNALSEGLNLSGCIIVGSEYSYKFLFMEDDRVVVGYGGNFETKGNLSTHLTVLKVALSEDRDGNRRVIRRRRGPIQIHLNRSI